MSDLPAGVCSYSTTAAEHAPTTVARGSHPVGGLFHTFRFFELQPRSA